MKQRLLCMLVVIQLVMFTRFTFAQQVIDSCNVLAKDFIYGKSRVLEVKSKKQVNDVIYSVSLNRGTTYVITVCKKADSKSDMELQLLDSRDRIILTNFSSEKQKYYEKVTFNCNASGIYYLHYIFDGKNFPGKGESTIGYRVNKKNNSKG